MESNHLKQTCCCIIHILSHLYSSEVYIYIYISCSSFAHMDYTYGMVHMLYMICKDFFFFSIFEEYIPGFTSTYKVMWRWPNIAEMKFEKHHIHTMTHIHNTSVQNKLYIISFFFLLEDSKN